MAILTYGAELHSKPSEKEKVHVAEGNRFITGGWRGSNRERLADIAGIAKLEQAMKRKRIQWAARIYERGVKELREVAENILRGCLEEPIILRWPGEAKEKIQQLEVLGKSPERGVYTDGSRIDGHTAAATITKAQHSQRAGRAGPSGGQRRPGRHMAQPRPRLNDQAAQAFAWARLDRLDRLDRPGPPGPAWTGLDRLDWPGPRPVWSPGR